VRLCVCVLQLARRKAVSNDVHDDNSNYEMRLSVCVFDGGDGRLLAGRAQQQHAAAATFSPPARPADRPASQSGAPIKCDSERAQPA
jgi:hypothetical protein